MKALVLEKNGLLAFKHVADPMLEADECLLGVAYAGLCNSDIQRAFEGGAYHYPLIMGHEFSGIVLEAGKNVRRFRKGDRVAVFPLLPCFSCAFCREKRYVQCASYDYYGSRRDGAFAERIAIKEWNLVKIPASLSLASAALIELTAVGVHTARMAASYLPSTGPASIFVMGAGVIGQTVVHWLAAHKRKPSLLWMDRNPAKLSGAKKEITKIPTAGFVEAVTTQTQGGAHVVVEATGAASNFVSSLQAARSGGAVVWVANPHGDVSFPKKEVSGILRKELRIQGVWNSRYDPAHRSADDWTEAIRFLGRFRKTPWIDYYASLEEGPELFDRLRRQKKADSSSGAPLLKAAFKIGS